MSDESEPTAAGGEFDSTVASAGAGAAVLPFERVGPYRLLQPIGQGGMGEVFIAEQTHPLRRQVALKIIRLGMDSSEVVARFEAERQALAMMDHPYIARVFDAGTTESGRPYFVMEYIRGLPITEYCDRHRLGVRERLALFIKVAEAVQHAHQKAIIHRDLKPSNILVTPGEPPTPKIIDFGVAKATAQRLTEKTMFTAMGQLIGTPEYMSPEQAELTGEDIDTRTDIYALGVILYELLTGVLPFDPAEFRKAGFDEMRRQIREVEWPRPSTRFSTLGPDTARVAKNRQTEGTRLASALRGDLDWITMKAMEKDRARRYETANGLAMDVARYLNGETVLASPPSAGYRLQKMARRHRGAFVSLGAILLVLLAATVVSTSLFLRARTEERRARTEAARSAQIAAFMKKMLAGVGPSAAMGRDTKMLREILDGTQKRVGSELAGQPEVEAGIRSVLASTYADLGEFAVAESSQALAVALLRKARGDSDSLTLEARSALAVLAGRLGRVSEAESLLVVTSDAQRKLLGGAHPQTLASLSALAEFYVYESRSAEAESLGRITVPLLRRTLGESDPLTQSTMLTLAGALTDDGRFAPAESLYLSVIGTLEREFGPDQPTALAARTSLGWMYRQAGRLPEAEKMTRETLVRERRVYGNDHSETQTAVNNLAIILKELGRTAEAEPLYVECVETGKRTLGERHPETLASMVNLATFYLLEKRYAKSLDLCSHCIDLFNQVMPPDFYGKGVALKVRGECQLRLRNLEASEKDLSAAYGIFVKQSPPGSPRLRDLAKMLGDVTDQLGHAQQAAQWRAKAAPAP
jgi:serine/threonine protein kinase/tetratricopeptide (TPR) repeat protein